MISPSANSAANEYKTGKRGAVVKSVIGSSVCALAILLGIVAGPAIGRDKAIGASLSGDFPTLQHALNDPGRFIRIRNAAQEQGAKALDAQRTVFGQANDPASLFGALTVSLDAKGAVRSSLYRGVAETLGVPAEWSQMTPQQFALVMSYLSQDRSRLMQIEGSGDIPYLDTVAAGNIGEQAARESRARTASLLGLAQPTYPENAPAPPFVSSGYIGNAP
jgi:hypothetical protein